MIALRQKERGKAISSHRLSPMTISVFFLFTLGLISLLGTFPTEYFPRSVPGASIANVCVWLSRLVGGRELYASPFFIFILALFVLLLAVGIIQQIKALVFKRKAM